MLCTKQRRHEPHCMSMHTPSGLGSRHATTKILKQLWASPRSLWKATPGAFGAPSQNMYCHAHTDSLPHPHTTSAPPKVLELSRKMRRPSEEKQPRGSLLGACAQPRKVRHDRTQARKSAFCAHDTAALEMCMTARKILNSRCALRTWWLEAAAPP